MCCFMSYRKMGEPLLRKKKSVSYRFKGFPLPEVENVRRPDWVNPFFKLYKAESTYVPHSLQYLINSSMSNKKIPDLHIIIPNNFLQDLSYYTFKHFTKLP